MKESKKYFKFLLSLVALIVGIVLLIFVGGKLLIFFFPFVIGWIIAMIANPLVRFLERKIKMVRKHSSMIIVIGVLAAIIGLGYLAVNKAVEQVGTMIEQAPEIYEAFNEDIQVAGKNLEGVYNRLPDDVKGVLSGAKESLASWSSEFIQSLSTPTVNAAKNFVKYLPTLFVMIIFTILSAYFFVADRDKILDWGRAHTPKVVRDKWQLVERSFKKAFGGYFKAQFKIMAVVYVILLVGLLVLRVNFAVLVAFLIAFLDMLPFFGTGTVLLPWAVFQFLAGDTKQAIMLLIIYAISQIVHQVLQPKLVGDSVGINPLYALVLMYIGFKFSGVFGMIIAIPIGMILMNFYEAGAFDNVIDGFKMIAKDIYRFVKS